MNNKLPYVIGGGILLVLVVFLAVSNKPQQISQTQVQVPSNTHAVAVTAQPTSVIVDSKNPQDIVPGLYKKLIQNTATQVGFMLVSTTVENNTDATGKTVGDHLQLSLKNTTGNDLTNFEVYYTITDVITKQKEGYYKKLDGFMLKAGETKSVDFDNKPGDGHFSTNKNSIYFTSTNQLLFDVMVSSNGYKVQTAQVTKSAGGAETKD